LVRFVPNTLSDHRSVTYPIEPFKTTDEGMTA
jgi:hypothetical protein